MPSARRRLPGGKLNCWLLELRGPTEPTTHPGEEFVFCLRGGAKLTVAGRGYVLDEGDAATFWCAELHGYEPAAELGPDDPSVLLLSVWVAAADLASG
jgi:quercetin dioxygenase-like cupin family protein